MSMFSRSDSDNVPRPRRDAADRPVSLGSGRYQSMDEGLRRGMRRPAAFVIAVALAALLISGVAFVPTYAQLQQSGGGGSNSSVGSTGAAAPGSATLTGGAFNTTLPTLTTGQMGALQVDSNGRLLVASIAGNSNVTVTAALPAGTNIIGSVNTIPKTACGNTVASQALAAVPTTATAVFTTTTCVVAVVLNNTTGASLTVTVSDNQATPVNDVVSFSIPANSQLVQPLYGVAFTSGIKWNASATGVTGAILGYQ